MNKIAREQADLYQDFFNFLSQEHNLTCTIEEMDEIIHEAQTFVKKFDIANVVVPKGTLCEHDYVEINSSVRYMECSKCGDVLV